MIADIFCFIAKLLSGLTIRWSGCKPDDKQRVYFANHTSHMDFVMIWAALPKEIRKKTQPIAAKDYWGCGRFRKYIANKIIHAVLIKRNQIVCRHNENPINIMCEALDKGSSLIIFPEGTRNTHETIKNFQSGLYHLCKRRKDIEYIPVYLENLSRILPKGEFLPIPILGSVTFGAPLTINNNELKADFLNRARQAIEELKQL